jgi:CHAT domain-containing protein
MIAVILLFSLQTGDSLIWRPLPWSLVEIDSIATIVSMDRYIGDEATKENFLKEAPDAVLLHLATHAEVHDRDPMLSRLVFSPRSSDPYLYASEIYGLSLKADLVVLSACETGLGQWARGEGVMSLARAFMIAGCPQVVMSLWAVDDRSTAQLMTDFYRGIDSELPPHEALRQAKLKMLDGDNPVYAHPYYWAGWVPIGGARAVELSRFPQKLVAAIVLILLALTTMAPLIYRQIRKRN